MPKHNINFFFKSQSSVRDRTGSIPAQCSAVASQLVFSFASNSSYSRPRTQIPLPLEVVNPGRRHRDSTFVPAVTGIHFVEVCVGIPAGRASMVSPYIVSIRDVHQRCADLHISRPRIIRVHNVGSADGPRPQL